MKRSMVLILVVVLLSTFSWRCTKEIVSTDQSTLKTSLSTGVQSVKTAMEAIQSSAGYKVLMLNENTLKTSAADSLYNVEIYLDSIAGVYDYHPTQIPHHGGGSVLRFFTKTAASNLMIVKMPAEKMRHPRDLFFYRPQDTALVNNFVISVSEYTHKYTWGAAYDYKLAAGIAIGDTAAGTLNIATVGKVGVNYDYNSSYDFGNGYVAKYKALSGDTSVISNSIWNGANLVYEEKVSILQNTMPHYLGEREYSLTIGNVQIVRKLGNITEVYLNGVLQQHAVIEIIDTTNDPQGVPSVCRKRDIKITFDDGTSVTLSALAGQMLGNVNVLFSSLKQVYFAAGIVDRITYEIYKNKK